MKDGEPSSTLVSPRAQGILAAPGIVCRENVQVHTGESSAESILCVIVAQSLCFTRDSSALPPPSSSPTLPALSPLLLQLKKIGQGSFGTAMLCQVKATGERVVVKIVDVKDMPEEERKTARRGEATTKSGTVDDNVMMERDS